MPCSTSLLLASNNMCLYFQKSSDMLSKNTLGVKKVRGQPEAANRYVRPKTLISAEAKKLALFIQLITLMAYIYWLHIASYLFAMLLLIGLALFYTQGVFV